MKDTASSRPVLKISRKPPSTPDAAPAPETTTPKEKKQKPPPKPTKAEVAAAQAELEAELKKTKDTARLIAADILATLPTIAACKPLALGSGKTIKAWIREQTNGQVSGIVLAELIRNHCNSKRYIDEIAKGGKRYDPMTGEESGEISAKEQSKAAMIKKRMKQKKVLPNVE